MIERTKLLAEGIGAPQFAVVPPLIPIQDQVHGPTHHTTVGVQKLQSPTAGLRADATLFAGPQTPFIGIGLALQFAVVPPLIQAHDQVHGPVPDTADGAPTLQSHVEGVEATLLPFVGPHTPFTGTAV